MTTDQLITILSICTPLVVAWLAAILAPAWKWLMAHSKDMQSTALGRACLQAAKSVAHGLLQGQLLTPEHLNQALSELRSIDPNADLSAATPVLRSAFHDINTSILQVVAQQKTAATASTPALTVVPPTIDYGALAATLLKVLVPVPAPADNSALIVPGSAAPAPPATVLAVTPTS